MQSNIETILQELYELDPALREHETELRTLLAELVRAKPETSFDKAFAEKLRRRLLAVKRPVPSPFFSLAFFNTTAARLGAGIALVALLVVTITYFGSSTRPTELALGPEIEEVSRNAFGDLLSDGTEFGERGGGGSISPMETSAPESLSLGVPAMPPQAEDRSGSGGGVSGSVEGKQSMIYPSYPVSIKYVYQGDPVELQAEGDVYRRRKGISGSSELGKLLQNFNFDMLNLNAFGSLNVRSLELVSGKNILYLNAEEGIAHLTTEIGKEEYLARPQKNIEPKDAIRVANNFLDRYGISREGYGDPVVLEAPHAFGFGTAGSEMAVSSDSASYPIYNNFVTIIYPLSIDGQPVYDGTMLHGLQVTLNGTDKSVMGVQNIATRVYEKSLYKLETDFTAVLKSLEGMYGGYYPEHEHMREQKTIEVILTTPEKVLMRHWRWDGVRSDELHIPALLFQSQTEGYGDVIVPL
ncbi:MAG: hypothetical protein Q7S15_01180, partial [bacterium]|nr:hypothetical protein [bacterium]